MKKIFFLSLVLCAVMGLSAQTVILSEDFSAISDSTGYAFATGGMDEFTSMPGWTYEKAYPANGKVKLGTSSVKGWLKTPELNLSDNGGQFVLNFDAMRWKNDQSSLNVFVNDVQYTVTNMPNSENGVFEHYSLELNGGTSTTTIKFEAVQAGNARFFIDNVVVISQAAGPDTIAPFVTAVNPNANMLAVTFNELLDATSAQTAANYSLDNNINVTAAALNGSEVTLTLSPAMTEGLDYTLVVNNVADTAGNVIVADTFAFTYGVSPEFQVANIAELRSKLSCVDLVYDTSMVEYKLTGEVTVTATAAYNNQKIIQDATGAILIYDPGNVIGALEVGDNIKDLYGKLTNYYGLLEFQPTQPGVFVSPFNIITPLNITLAQLDDPDFMIQHQSELIKLHNVTFAATGTFTTPQAYEITQNGVTSPAVQTYFRDANVVGADIPTGEVNLTGFSYASSRIGSQDAAWGFRYYLVPRSMNDFTTGIENYVSAADVTVTPNPAEDYIRINVTNDKFQMNHIFVFNVNGKVVAAENVTSNAVTLDVNDLTSGMYFLRLSDGKVNVTTKFIKK